MNCQTSTTIEVSLRFFGDLNNLITLKKSGPDYSRSLPETTSVKDLIEGCGVPHTEVDLILVNGNRVDFSRRIEGGEKVSVYPFFQSIRLPSAGRLMKTEFVNPRFIADVNLGKLAGYLRLAGFDTSYSNQARDNELIDGMINGNRILLTRDRKLLMRNAVIHGYLPRSSNPVRQLEEVFKRFNLYGRAMPFTRCTHCNGLLEPVDKKDVINQLEPLTKKHFDNFSRCNSCGQVYWAGSHRRRLHPRLEHLLKPVILTNYLTSQYTILP